MTDFQFSGTNSNNGIFRTDYVGDPTNAGANVTICAFVGCDPSNPSSGAGDDSPGTPAATATLFAKWQKIRYTIHDFIVFAQANSLGLIARSIGNNPAATPVTLV